MNLPGNITTLNFDIDRCAICMVDFDYGDAIRFLPCLHIYHKECIDDWLIRSFTCPSCMEPVDAALLSSYETSELKNQQGKLPSRKLLRLLSKE